MKNFILLILLFLSFGCSDDVNSSGENNLENEVADITVYSLEELTDSNGDPLEDSFLITDGTSGVSIQLDESTGVPTRATLIAPTINDEAIIIEFDSFGRPSLVAIDGNYIAIGNHSGTTADISCVNSSGESYALQGVECSVDWSSDVFSTWSSTNTLSLQTRYDFVEGLTNDMKTIGIGVAYGIKSLGDFIEILSNVPTTTPLGSAIDIALAISSATSNLGQAIVEVLPGADSYALVYVMIEFDNTDVIESAKNLRDLYGLSTSPISTVVDKVTDQLFDMWGDYLLDILRDEELVEQAIAAIGTGDHYTSSEGSTSTGGDEDEPNNNILTEVPDGYIGLYTAEDVYNVRNDLAANYIMMSNINLSEYESWEPIGTYFEYANISTAFVGTFDGNGNSISGLVINSSEDYQALFGYTAKATIKNLTIKSPNIVGGSCVAALVAFTSYRTVETTISSCGVVGGSISGIGSVGAILGSSAGCYVSNCYNEGATISGGDYVGGIAGLISASFTTFTTGDFNYYGTFATVTSCYNTGRVSGDNRVGGIVGRVTSSARLTAGYNRGTVSGMDYVGGVSGEVSRTYSLDIYRYPEISDCYNVATVTVSSGEYVGGVVGYNYEARYWDCYFVDQQGDSSTAAFGYSSYGTIDGMLLTSISELNSAIATSYYVAGSNSSVDLPSLLWE